MKLNLIAVSLEFVVLQIFLLVIIFGLFFGLVFLPVILSYFGPSECHSHSEYETTPNDDKRRRRLNKHDDDTSNKKEMVSFIQPNENIETVETAQKDSN